MLSWVDIKRSAIEYNLKAFRDLIGPSILLIPVVKSNAYGHGLLEVARICEKSGEADRLAVVNLDEALLLRACGIKKPIQVLSFYQLEEEAIIESIQKNIILPIYRLDQARFINRVGERIGLTATVHLKIDTGTTRIGVPIEDADSFMIEIKKLTYLKFEGIWSHFSSAESNHAVSKKQLTTLEKTNETLKKYGIRTPIRHIACTASTILYPDSRLEAVRVGIGIYGLYPSLACKKIIKLEPVLSWHSTIIQTKNVKKGTKIGYGGTYAMKNSGTIATIPIGYYDGYSRAWGNLSEVLINGRRCRVRGRVCMNLMMAEIPRGGNAKAGDTITLIGTNGNEEVPADQLAKFSPGTINYEITTQINPLLPRIVI